MATLSVIFLLIAGFVVIETAARGTDFFSPNRLYVFFHSLAIGVAFLGLHKAMTPFEPLTWVVYLGSGGAYILGVWMSGAANKLHSVKILSRERESPGYNWPIHLRIAIVLFIIFLVAITIASIGVGSLPLLAKDKAAGIRKLFQVSLFSAIGLSYGGFVASLFFMYLFRPNGNSWFKNGGFWMMVLTIAIYICALSRSGLIYFVFFSLVYYHQAIRKLSILKLSLFFLVCFSLFLTTAYLKLTNIQKQTGFNTSPEHALILLLKIPYIYIGNNFWNLDYALNPEEYHERHPTTYGFTTASGLLDMMLIPGGSVGGGIRDEMGYDDQFQKHIVKVKGLNTVGYQWGLFKDFGVSGTIILPLLFGLVIGTLYRNMKRSPSILKYGLYAYLSFFVGLSWFLAFWESMIYIYGLIFLSIICFVCQRLGANIKRIEPLTASAGEAVPGVA